MPFLILSFVSFIIGLFVSLVANEGTLHLGFAGFVFVGTFIILLIIYLGVLTGFDEGRPIDIWKALGLQKVQSIILNYCPKFYFILKKSWQQLIVICFMFGLPLAYIMVALVFVPLTHIQCATSTSSCKVTTNLFFTKTISIFPNTTVSISKQTFSRRLPLVSYGVQIGNWLLDYDIEKGPALEISTKLNNYIQQNNTNPFIKFHIPKFWIYYLIGGSILLLIRKTLFTFWCMLVGLPAFMSIYSCILAIFSH